MRKYYWENNPFVELLAFEKPNGLENMLMNSPNVRISGNDLEEKLLGNFEGAVTEGFKSDAPQYINDLYYSQPQFAFANNNQLANLYNTLKPLNIAVSNVIREAFPGKRNLTILEVGVGNKKESWRLISEELSEYQLNLIATDYDDPYERMRFDSQKPENLTIETERLNLKRSIDPSKYPKVDLVIGTYVFDSLWFENDLHLSNDVDGKWFISKSRVKVSPKAPRFNRMTAALKAGIAPFDISREDFNYVVIEEIVEEFDIESHPYAELLKEKYEEKGTVSSFNFSGGLINKINELSELLVPGGVILLGEVAINSSKRLDIMRSSNRTGSAARYKVDDYHLLSEILNNSGYKAEIYPFKRLAKDYVYSGWEKDFSRKDTNFLHENKYNCILRISKDS